MLTYDINTRERISTSTALEPYDWSISEDKFEIRFVVDADTGVIDGDRIILSDDTKGERRTFTAHVSVVRRQGYIMYPNEYQLHEDDDGRRTIVFSDGVEMVAEDGNVTVNGTEYPIVDGKVTIPERTWVEDGKMVVDGDTIDIDTDLVPDKDGKHHPQTIGHEGVEYEWFGYEPSEWKYVSKVTLKSNGFETIRTDGASCGKLIPYIIFGGEVKRISVETEKDETGQNVKVYYIEDGHARCELERETEFGNERVSIDGEPYGIEYELASTKHGQIVLIYTDGFNNVKTGDEITVSITDDGTYRSEVVSDETGDHTIWYANRYDKEEGTWDFVAIGDKEYEIVYDDNDKESFTIDLNGSECRFRIEGADKAVRLNISATEFLDETHYGLTEYDIMRYDYFVIDGERRKVTTDERPINGEIHKVNYVDVPNNGSYRLIVSNIYDPNILKCDILSEGLDETEYEDECEVAAGRINDGTIIVKRFDRLFDGKGSEESGDDVVYETPFETIDAMKVNDYMNVSIPLSVDFAENLFIEDLVCNQYKDRVVAERMNGIVDVEKDIYYPVTSEGEYADEITIRTHFRERDKEWNVLELGSWNQYDEEHMGKSDLLCFLGFKNTDVYYQKSKLAKSFIRISVFDGTDPSTQTLMYMGTAFIDEKALYKKMMDSEGSGKRFHPYYNTGTTYDSSTVSSECADTDAYRLDSTIRIDDRDETDTSSEGFYWYIFRERGLMVEEQTLYARFDFCHAGKGIAIPLVPMPSDETGTSYINTQEDYDAFALGYRLEDVYDNMYIPVTARYDFDKKRYVYSFPEYMESKNEDGNNSYELNMFELKIMDES